MPLAPGARLGPYEILAPIGAGGMGEVYKARDTRLDRVVAVKVSKEQFSERFAREARAVAALNHPHICTLHDVGADYLVMEYIEGPTLKGPLPLQQALKYAAQICDALDAAHSKNIIHRDLKPANILVNKSGIKLLDFGLAKVNREREVADSDATESLALTAERSIVGTLQYMSPEQLEGKPADARSDIFSFGAVLYEIVTGKVAFEGASAANVIAAILAHDPPSIGAAASPALDQLVARCLAKNPEDRWQSMRDLKYELEQIAVSGSAPGTTPVSTERVRKRHYKVWVALAAVVLAVAVWAAVVLQRNGRANQRSVAVLPFANMSPDKDQEYFSDGLTEELLNGLTKVRGLRVAGRTSSFQFKGKTEAPRVIGQKLHVATILEGSVRKQNNRAKIDVRLIKTEDGLNLWAESYDRDLNDIFVVQEEIAHQVTLALKVAILGEKAAGSTPKTQSVEAYNAYLQGSYFVKRVNKEKLEKAAGYFEQALHLDPNFAEARVGLAFVLSLQAGYALIPPEEGYRRAREQIQRALNSDANLVAAYNALGWIQMDHDWDWPAADASFQRARALEPGNAYALSGAATLAWVLNHLDDAVSLYRQALDIDPLNAAAYRDFGLILHYAGHQQEAVDSVKKALDLAPDINDAHRLLARIYLAQSRTREALAEAEKEELTPFKLQGLALAYHALGLKQESDANLANLIEVARVDAPFQIAEVYAFRGAKDQAFEWLEQAYKERDGGLINLKGDPLLRNLERDPRYAAFLKRMRLAN
jgi:serine/threonine-protein kinase